MNFSLRLTERRTLLILGDVILINAATLFVFWLEATRRDLRFGRTYLLDQIEWFLIFSGLWLLSAFVTGMYEPRQNADAPSASATLLRTLGLAFLVYLVVYFYIATPSTLPRALVLSQGVTTLVLIMLWRVVYVAFVQRPGLARKVIVVGAGWAGQTIAQAIHEHAGAFYQMVGFVDDDRAKRGASISIKDRRRRTAPAAVPIIGDAPDLVRLVQEHRVPEIIVAITQDISAPMFQAIMACKEQGAQITMMPLLFEQLTGQVPIEHIGDNWNVALPLDSAEAGGFYPIAKRVFDLVGALVGLFFFALLLPFVIFAQFIDSRGPIFYTQARVGKGGKVFQLFKLRTMIPDAEVGGQAQRAQQGDPRITRVGRLLRKMRLDEMPQLLNILRGDMSAVGPRPERPEHLAELDRVIPFHRLRNAVKPGMAGWAAVNYDYIDSVEDARIRLQYDLYYIKHQSLWLDIIILVRMIGHMFALKGR